MTPESQTFSGVLVKMSMVSKTGGVYVTRLIGSSATCVLTDATQIVILMSLLRGLNLQLSLSVALSIKCVIRSEEVG